MNFNGIDPQYIQIGKAQAANILGISISELDLRRKNDPDFPKGFKEKPTQFSPVRFRLSDIYAYSELVMSRAVPA
jgi:hypothetical protein